MRSDAGSEWTGSFFIGADGANSGIAKDACRSVAAVRHGSRIWLSCAAAVNNVAPTVVAFLPGWVGYAWAFPRPDHISFGIATTQDAFKHEPLDDLLWQFMIGYYQQCEGQK